MGGFVATERWQDGTWKQGKSGMKQSFRDGYGLAHIGPANHGASLELYFKNQGKQKINKTLGFWRGIEN